MRLDIHTYNYIYAYPKFHAIGYLLQPGKEYK